MLLVAGLPAGAIMTLPAEAARAEARGSATGVYFAWSYGLMAFLPAMAGYLRDITESRAVPMLFAAAMLAMGAVGVALFRAMAKPAAAPAR